MKLFTAGANQVGKFNFISTLIDGVFEIEPTVFGDRRGYFLESYNRKDFFDAGITSEFVQDNQSYSRKGTLRGMHLQERYPQAKLVRVLSGEVFDVCVDVRRNSPTFAKWHGVYLSGENRRQFFVPRGLAHGFLVLSETAEFVYKCDEFYHPDDENGFIWNDPSVAIQWPLSGVGVPLLSEKDAALPLLVNRIKNPG